MDVASGNRDESTRSDVEHRLRVQRDLAVALSEASTLDEAFHSCLDAAFRLSNMDSGGIYDLCAETGAMTLRVHHGLGPAFVDSVREFPASDPRFALIQSGAPVFVPRRDLPIDDENVAIEGIRFLSILPVVARDRVIACLNLASHTEEDATEEVREALRSMTGQVGNVIQRLQAQEELARREAELSDLFQHATDSIVVTTEAGEIRDANPSFVQMTGLSLDELIGCSIYDLDVGAATADNQTGMESSRSGPLTTRRRRIRRKDGAVIEVDGRARRLPNGLTMAMYRDITEDLRLEAERERTEKLESVGLLAGGIAHDFNNILTAAMGYIDLARQRAKRRADELDPLDRAAAAIARARQLTRQFQTFARGAEPIRRVISLGAVVRESVGFALRGSNASCRFELPADLWAVDADETQIGQVFHNLVLNALQAAPEGAEIIISAENRDTSDDAPNVGDGPFVSIAVRDHGVGIAPDLLPRIFDPYFSTKHGGTGLGLSSAFGIIRRHGGHISADSVPGQGSTFHILLPAKPDATAAPKTQEPARQPRGGRILVMDDEAPIRALLLEALGEAGYQVTAVETGEEAEAEWLEARAASRPYDLAIMDLTIPGGMGGLQCVQRLRAVDPDLRAIVSSGYSTDPVMGRFREEGFDGVCAKPYRLSELLGEIERVLRGPETG
jgi:two-component system cell cycle sensor histidine kinase/response regulator CckA